jgi:aspartyl-tRNA synthetase
MAVYMENLKGFIRSHHCGELRSSNIGEKVSVCGWVQRRRDLGGLTFITVRDRSGILQCTFNVERNKPLFDKASSLRTEYVIAVEGVLRSRGDGAVNPDMPTGEVELIADDLRILSEAETTPFEILDKTNVNEELRLKYRYLDLRRPGLQQNIITRHKIAKVTRDYFYENDFIEIETPMMIKSTPEGARDYIVPSRIHKGKFYALPQSPQIYKQLLMLSGFERYIQLARCFRDEDLRADRQPEFTQIDIEMSFVDVGDVLSMIEGYIKRLFGDILDIGITVPLQRLSYNEAMSRYGSDKPDTRYGMEITDISDIVKDCGFGVFTSAVLEGGSVRAITAKNSAGKLTRKEIDKLTEYVRGIGAKGLAYVRWTDDTPACSFSKFISGEELERILAVTDCKKGDVLLIAADKNKVVLPVLGSLRTTLAKQLGMIPEGYNFLWITDFPFFEKDEETGEFLAMHHPFTMPSEDSLEYIETAPEKVYAKAYDLVVNGVELCSGSIRISDYKLQERMFKALGLTKEEIDAKFGFLVDAYRYGAPPHGGVGLGLDRIAMIMCGAENLRDVTAFPKVQNASELMSDCPSAVDTAQLEDLGIALTEKK